MGHEGVDRVEAERPRVTLPPAGAGNRGAAGRGRGRSRAVRLAEAPARRCGGGHAHHREKVVAGETKSSGGKVLRPGAWAAETA